MYPLLLLLLLLLHLMSVAVAAPSSRSPHSPHLTSPHSLLLLQIRGCGGRKCRKRRRLWPAKLTFMFVVFCSTIAAAVHSTTPSTGPPSFQQEPTATATAATRALIAMPLAPTMNHQSGRPSPTPPPTPIRPSCPDIPIKYAMAVVEVAW